MRKFYPLIASLLVFTQSFAQISLTATAGTTGPAPYATLKSAFDAINAGTHQGLITINLNGTVTETATAVLNASGSGAASYASVFIGPTVVATITGNLASPLVDINGANNVTLDGRIGATGTTKSLTVQNTSTSGISGTSTIRFKNDAANDIVNFVNIEGSGSSTGSGTVLFSGTTGSIGNSQIAISNNDIGPAGINLPVNAIYSIGQSSSATNNNITISDNSIHDFFNPASQSIGIYANNNNSAWIINGNSLFQTATRTNTANNTNYYGIEINSGNSHAVSNNFIGGSTANAGGTPSIHNSAFTNNFRGIFLNVGTVTPSTIDGNTITNLDLSVTSASPQTFFSGITVYAGKVSVGLTTGNIIGAAIGTGAITYSVTNSSNSYFVGIYSLFTAADIRNNIIGAITLNGNSTGLNVLTGIESDNHTTSVNIQNNTIGGSTPNSIQANGVNNSITGISLYSTVNGVSAVISNNTIQNLLNNGVSPHIAEVYGISSYYTNNITMSTTITNNNISYVSSSSASATLGDLVGVGLYSSSPTSSSDASINGNQISNFNSAGTGTANKLIGIDQEVSFPNFMNINNNIIHAFTTAGNYTLASGGVAHGIRMLNSGAGIFSMNGNTIHDIECTGTGASTHVIGIGCEYGNASATISKNRIYDLRNTNAPASGLVSGMFLRGVASSGTFNVNNNMISLTPSNVQTYGIHNNLTASQINMFHNSVSIAGTASGANNSAAFYRNDANNNTAIGLRDNIFYNTRSGGTGTHFSIMNDNVVPSTGWTGTASDYNDLYNSDPASITLWGTSTLSLPLFQVASSGDVHSKAITVSFSNTMSGDLHLASGSWGDQNLIGIPVGGTTDDYDGDARNATTPYMGADENLAYPLPVTIEFFTGIRQSNNHLIKWKANCISTTVNFIIQRSGDGRIFHEVGSILATQDRCELPFEYIDNAPALNINYYRLKIIEMDGTVTWSKIIAIVNNNIGFVFEGITPTVVSKEPAVLRVVSSERTVFEIIIRNIHGSLMKKQKIIIEGGSNTVDLNVNNLPNGSYFLTGHAPGGYIRTIRFVKQ